MSWNCEREDCPVARLHLQRRGDTEVDVNCGKCGKKFRYTDSPPDRLNPLSFWFRTSVAGFKRTQQERGQ